MADADKLAVYNDVLSELGDAELDSLSETSERLARLDAVYETCIKFVLKQAGWNFATRRASITFVSDTAGFPPYTFRGTLPSDYLQKTWIRASAFDSHEIQHAIAGSAVYSYDSVGLMEYVSDDADDVIDPSNWPPLFRQTVVYYIAHQVSVKLTHLTAELKQALRGLYLDTLAQAKPIEAVVYADQDIPANRMRVMRRAMEFMGQVMIGVVPVYDQVNQLTWAMQQAWDDCLKHTLEAGAWNFATRRATLTGGGELMPGDIEDNIIEGYTVAPATEETATDLPDASAYDYGYPVPTDFLHKIWVRADANNEFETPHQFLNYRVFANVEPLVMEYISKDAEALDPDNWPQSFTDAFAAQLALSAAPRLEIVQGKDSRRVDAAGIRRDLEGLYREKLSMARTKDAIQQFPKRLASGVFVRARGGSYFGYANRRLR